MNLLSAVEAQQICLQQAARRNVQRVALADALGRIAAEDLVSAVELPPFCKSLMDGYAVRSEDVAFATDEQPIALQVIGEVAAGNWPEGQLLPFSAVRTMTGGPVIAGADAVIRLEHVQIQKNGNGGQSIFVTSPVKAGESVQQIGEDLPKGALILRAGTRIGGSETAVLAAAGITEISVVRTPVAGILSTGNELVPANESPQAGQIRNSNGPMLTALLREAGMNAFDGGQFQDTVDSLKAAANSVLEQADLVITTGGVSVGDYDLVPEAMQEAGFRILFQHARIRPGKPVTVAAKDGKMWFALPGNPAAAFLTAHLFLLPALRKMAGESAFLRTASAKLLSRPSKKVLSMTSYWFGQARLQNGLLVVDAGQPQSPSRVSSLLGINALVEVGEGEDPQAGQTVRILLIGEVSAG